MTVSPILPPSAPSASAGPRRSSLAAVPDPVEDESPLRSVSTAVAVLDCFDAEPELGATRVAARLGIAKSTACRMLAALASGGLLERTEAGRYRLGLRLFEYGQLAADRNLLREVAVPMLDELRESVRETVQLAVTVGTDVLYLERLETPGTYVGFRSDHRRNPGHSSSSGKAVAAFDPTLEAAILDRGLVRRTPFTVVDPRRYRTVLAQAREQGYATSREEYIAGWSSIAAPVLLGPTGARRPVGAVSVVGSTARILGPRRSVVVQGVRRAAAQVASALERATR